MDIVGFLLMLLVLACVAVFAFWIITKMELEPPIRQMALAVVGVILLLILLGSVTGYIPSPTFQLPRR